MAKLNIEESLLINLIKERNALAQKTLFERYFKQVFLLCYRYVPNQMDAEEIVSDVFYKSFKFIQKFENRGDGSFLAWISKIAVNECLAFLRKKKLITFPLEEIKASDYKEDTSGLEMLSAAELLKEISNMPNGYRTVFNLFILEGYTHKEIAQQLKISESTSKTQLMQAKLLLQRKIKSHEKSF